MLEILLPFPYFVFVAWSTIATYLNYVLVPWKSSKFSISNGVSLTYAVLWGIALTLPIAYSAVFHG